jgi:alkanesulfonate monooxygenase SsuD/methylene tetrahydromethanopterin reductase-like flavin-dependent oxidoreductase (luciferase family)
VADYGHDLAFGSFLTPSQSAPESVVGLAQLSEELGLDLVTFQDHPYQPALLDTWTLMSYVAAATVQIKIAPNVLNLPLRPPAVVARAAASLDRLSGGRFELGLGAGAFWDAIEAMGGTRLSPGESVVALGEAVQVIRQIWDTDVRGGVRVDGEHYRVVGAKRGPAPVHDIKIWLGAYKPRILRLTGRVADGWLPSSSYLPPAELAAAHAIIDEAALAAGRQPADVRRLYNVSGSFARRSGGFLDGPTDQWVDELTELAVEHGIATFILGTDDPEMLAGFAEDVVPLVREAVAARRTAAPAHGLSGPASPPAAGASSSVGQVGVTSTAPGPPVSTGAEPRLLDTTTGTRSYSPSFTVSPTVDDGTRLAAGLWDESERPAGPDPDPDRSYSRQDLAGAQQLVDVHDHLRAELTQIRDLVAQVLDGTTTASAARSAINEMTLRQNNWTVGAYCAAYCRLVTTHHSIEDLALFPRIRASDPALAPVVDRLHWEHQVIHEVLDGVDRALVAFVGPQHDGQALQLSLDQLTDTLLSHLSYEERELVEPIARLGVLI